MTSERQRVKEEEEEETPRTESLSKRLVRTVCRSSSLSLEEREYLERFANRILRSTLTTTKTNAFLVDDDIEDEYSILDKIKDRVRDRKGFDVAVDVARLHERLHADEAWHRSVGKKREIFQLLWKLRREEDEEEDGSEGEEDKGQKYFDSPARTVKEEEDEDDGYYGLQTPGRDHHRTTRRGRSVTVERLLANDTFGTTTITSSGGERRARSRKSKNHEETLATMARALTPSHRHKMISPSTAAVSSPVGGPRDDAFNRLALERRRNGEVAESKLVRDCIFACNGIDGNYIKFDLVNDAYVIFPKDAPIAPGLSLIHI